MFTSYVKILSTFDPNWLHKNLSKFSIICSIDNLPLGVKNYHLVKGTWIQLIVVDFIVYTTLYMYVKEKKKFVKKCGVGKN